MGFRFGDLGGMLGSGVVGLGDEDEELGGGLGRAGRLLLMLLVDSFDLIIDLKVGVQDTTTLQLVKDGTTG